VGVLRVGCYVREGVDEMKVMRIVFVSCLMLIALAVVAYLHEMYLLTAMLAYYVGYFAGQMRERYL
jgi:hypothetical protein